VVSSKQLPVTDFCGKKRLVHRNCTNFVFVYSLCRPKWRMYNPHLLFVSHALDIFNAFPQLSFSMFIIFLPLSFQKLWIHFSLCF
jgi:hypothetical protein